MVLSASGGSAGISDKAERRTIPSAADAPEEARARAAKERAPQPPRGYRLGGEIRGFAPGFGLHSVRIHH
jgi:hypothetical protein